jgi:RHS repeat-associated protein
MNMSATQSIASKQNSAIADGYGNTVAARGHGTYGETDPAQMIGTTSAGSTALPALRAFSGSKRFPEPFCALCAPPPKPFGYTGRRWDPDLGLYYYRARWYDPQLGTFLQTDPIGSLDYVNLYSYVGLEPGNATDPTGMMCVGNDKVYGCTPPGPNSNALRAVGCTLGCTIFDQALALKVGFAAIESGISCDFPILVVNSSKRGLLCQIIVV